MLTSEQAGLDAASLRDLRSATDLALAPPKPDSVWVPPFAHYGGDERGGQSSLPWRSVSSGSLFGPAVKGLTERFTEAQKSSQAMRHFLPKYTSSSAAYSRLRPAPTKQTAKPTPATPELDLKKVDRKEGAHAQHDTTPSWSAKDHGPRSP